MVVSEGWGGAPTVEEKSERNRRQSYIRCGACNRPVPPDHPAQRKLDEEWEQFDIREKAEAERQATITKAADVRRAAEQRQAAAFEAAGMLLTGLQSEFAGEHCFVTLGLRLPAAATRPEIAALVQDFLATWREEQGEPDAVDPEAVQLQNDLEAAVSEMQLASAALAQARSRGEVSTEQQTAWTLACEKVTTLRQRQAAMTAELESRERDRAANAKAIQDAGRAAENELALELVRELRPLLVKLLAVRQARQRLLPGIAGQVG
jgi:hypothetical protein